MSPLLISFLSLPAQSRQCAGKQQYHGDCELGTVIAKGRGAGCNADDKSRPQFRTHHWFAGNASMPVLIKVPSGSPVARTHILQRRTTATKSCQAHRPHNIQHSQPQVRADPILRNPLRRTTANRCRLGQNCEQTANRCCSIHQLLAGNGKRTPKEPPPPPLSAGRSKESGWTAEQVVKHPALGNPDPGGIPEVGASTATRFRVDNHAYVKGSMGSMPRKSGISNQKKNGGNRDNRGGGGGVRKPLPPIWPTSTPISPPFLEVPMFDLCLARA